MRIEDLVADEQLRVRLFPAVGRHVYLAHASVAPLPAPVAAATVEHARRISVDGQFDRVVGTAEAELRDLAARLLDVRSAEIAFVPSTSAGLATVAEGLPWHAGDTVVVQNGDFPANIYPWLELRRFGVEVRWMPAGNQALGFADVERYLDDRTRLVTLSSAHFISGRPLRDLPEIGRELRRRGILLCVDAIQSLGAQRLSAREVDFLVADGHKWLLAPKGMGILYVRSTAMSQLRPALRGWRSMARPHDFSVQVELAGTARRYESGSLNEFGLVGLRAALGLLQAFGPDAVEERIRLLRQGLVSGLQDRQALVVGQPGAPDWSGIISFRLAHEPAGETVRRLARAGVVVSLRQPSGGEPVVRVAPHFYNTESEIDRFFETLYTG